ncbi:MAG: hypothetical protein KGI29_06000 [Pseudomonadota bacterium]|nr:hypothetical protein [Pseudomonadota bacterium]MDE3037108.1 hypothetical protein [Pseudomonadota bacterium]
MQELKPLTGRYNDPDLEARLKLQPKQKQPYAKKLEAEYRRITPDKVGAYGAMPPTIAQAIQLASDLHGAPDEESERRFRYSAPQRNKAFQTRLAASYQEAGLDLGDREIAKVLDRAAAVHVQFFSGTAVGAA